MDNLVQQYALLTPIAHLQSQSAFPETFNRVHDVLLNNIFLDPHLRAYPPAPEYQLRFWKWAIQKLEDLVGDQDTEIDTRMYEHLMELIQSVRGSQLLTNASVPPHPSYVTHYLRLCPETPNTIHRVTLLESRTTIEQGTTGLKTWPAAHALAAWLVKYPERVRGKRVLELGSGVGYLGLVVAAIQLDAPNQANPESSILLTDYVAKIFDECRRGYTLTDASSRHQLLQFKQLDWFSALDVNEISSTRGLMAEADPDVILGADIVYDPSIIPPLIATLQLAISVSQSTRQYPVSGVLALTVRRPEIFHHFFDAAEKAFTVTSLDTTAAKPELGRGDGNSGQEIVIIQLCQKDT